MSHRLAIVIASDALTENSVSAVRQKHLHAAFLVKHFKEQSVWYSNFNHDEHLHDTFRHVCLLTKNPYYLSRVCLSFCLHVSVGVPLDGFSLSLIMGTFVKIGGKKIHIWLELDTNFEYFTSRPKYVSLFPMA